VGRDHAEWTAVFGRQGLVVELPGEQYLPAVTPREREVGGVAVHRREHDVFGVVVDAGPVDDLGEGYAVEGTVEFAPPGHAVKVLSLGLAGQVPELVELEGQFLVDGTGDGELPVLRVEPGNRPLREHRKLRGDSLPRWNPLVAELHVEVRDVPDGHVRDWWRGLVGVTMAAEAVSQSGIQFAYRKDQFGRSKFRPVVRATYVRGTGDRPQ
jgi:hypothetical protein